MNAFKCDICGKFVELPIINECDDPFGDNIATDPMNIWKYNARKASDHLELCKECAEKVNKFLEEIKK